MHRHTNTVLSGIALAVKHVALTTLQRLQTNLTAVQASLVGRMKHGFPKLADYQLWRERHARISVFFDVPVDGMNQALGSSGSSE